MSTPNDGGAAFPIVSDDLCATGMSLRDYFAAHAIAATDPKRSPLGRAVQAYEISDMMLEHRTYSTEDVDASREIFAEIDEEAQS